MIESMVIRLAIMGVALVVSFGSGFALGVNWESNRRDAMELKRVQDAIIRVRTIVEEREKIVTKYVDRIVKIYVERDRVMEEVDKHAATIPDPRECWLDPERVRVINDAVGAAGKRSDAAAVPADQAAAVGESPGRGAVGRGLGFPLPRVFDPAGGSREDPEVSR